MNATKALLRNSQSDVDGIVAGHLLARLKTGNAGYFGQNWIAMNSLALALATFDNSIPLTATLNLETWLVQSETAALPSYQWPQGVSIEYVQASSSARRTYPTNTTAIPGYEVQKEERAETSAGLSRNGWEMLPSVVASLLDLEAVTAADLEDFGFPFTALDDFTEEEAHAFDEIRRDEPPQWIKDL